MIRELKVRCFYYVTKFLPVIFFRLSYLYHVDNELINTIQIVNPENGKKFSPIPIGYRIAMNVSVRDKQILVDIF